MKDWLKNKDKFEVIDVRKLQGNFLPAILKKAQSIEANNGLCIVQSFEPVPLYSAMQDLGYEHETNRVSETEYRIYFYRLKENDPELNIPFRPTAIVNFNTIDPELADTVVKFWTYIWEKKNPAIDMKTRLLLSLANGVGAGRMKQAVREFIKGYAKGITIEEFDELFAMFVWNQGVGFFSSEIGPSALFGAYRLVKSLENKGTQRDKIVKQLIEKFGEKNPEVGTMFQGN